MALTDDQIRERLWTDAKAEAIGMAKLAGHGSDQQKYTPEDEALLFMKEAPGWSIDKELALLAGGKSRAVVGAMKYPERQKLAASGARFLDKYEQAKYLSDMRQTLDPTWAPQPKAPGPPTVTDTTEAPPDAGPLSLEV